MNFLERSMNKLFGGNPKEEEAKMYLKSRFVSEGKYEVNGVIFYADTHNEALNKYRKANKFK